MHAKRFEPRMEPRTPIDLPMIQKNLVDFACELGIFSTVSRSLAAFPGIIAALGNLQRTTHDRDGILMPMFSNELIFHCWPREKMPMASDRISLTLDF